MNTLDSLLLYLTTFALKEGETVNKGPPSPRFLYLKIVVKIVVGYSIILNQHKDFSRLFGSLKEVFNSYYGPKSLRGTVKSNTRENGPDTVNIHHRTDNHDYTVSPILTLVPEWEKKGFFLEFQTTNGFPTFIRINLEQG